MSGNCKKVFEPIGKKIGMFREANKPYIKFCFGIIRLKFILHKSQIEFTVDGNLLGNQQVKYGEMHGNCYIASQVYSRNFDQFKSFA